MTDNQNGAVNLLVVSLKYSPELGSFRIVPEIAHGLADNGFNVTVLAACPSKDEWPQFRGSKLLRIDYEGKTKVIRMVIPKVKSQSSLSEIFSHLFSPIFFLSSLPLILGRFDCVLVFSPPITLYLWSGLVGKLAGKKVVAFVNDIHPRALVEIGLVKNKYEIKALEVVESLAYQLSDRIVAHSVGARNLLSACTHTQCVDIHLWSNSKQTTVGPKDNALRRSFGNPQFVVTFAGLMSYSQDLVTIIEAAAHLRDELDILFVLAGKGPQRDSLVKLAKDLKLKNVRFLPFLNTAEYNELCNASDVLLVPLKSSVKTTVVPSKIFDIMAVGRAVVLLVPADNDAVKIIEEAKCGLHVLPEHPADLADLVLRLKNDPNLLAQLELNSFAASKIYSLEGAVKKMSHIISCTLRRQQVG